MFNDMIGRDLGKTREVEIRRAVKASRPKKHNHEQPVAAADWLLLPVIVATVIGLVMA